jgi:hypothetical protein
MCLAQTVLSSVANWKKLGESLRSWVAVAGHLPIGGATCVRCREPAAATELCDKCGQLCSDCSMALHDSMGMLLHSRYCFPAYEGRHGRELLRPGECVKPGMCVPTWYCRCVTAFSQHASNLRGPCGALRWHKVYEVVPSTMDSAATGVSEMRQTNCRIDAGAARSRSVSSRFIWAPRQRVPTSARVSGMWRDWVMRRSAAASRIGCHAGCHLGTSWGNRHCILYRCIRKVLGCNH